MEVAELLSKKDIVFKQQGRDYLVCCLNPEHDDSNPSMRIDQITGVFNCFSCGYKGNLFSLFGEKANLLQQKRERLRALIEKKSAETVGLQKPVDAYPFDLEWRGISLETYNKFGAFQSAHKDFIHRVVFPITSASGKTTAFIGRHTSHGVPKYKIVPREASMPLFPVVDPVQGSVILVEGIFDMLNLYDKGLTNAVCSFGATTVTSEKIQLLKIQGVTKVYVLFDGDEAGAEGAEKVKDLCELEDVECKIIKLKNASDPGEMSETYLKALKRKLYDEP